MVAAIDGAATPDKEAALFEMARKTWGDKVNVEVVRKDGKHTLSATLPTPSAPPPASPAPPTPPTAPPPAPSAPSPHGK